MWKLGARDLTHPESLSENQLREILRNSCIENHKFEKLCKSELVEIYKRIAMPLPQRYRRSANNSDAKADTVRENSVADTSDNYTHSSTDLSKGNKRMCQSNPQNSDRLKPSVNDQISTHKKIQIHSAPKDTMYNGISKRRCTEQNEEVQTQKRQKITWP